MTLSNQSTGGRATPRNGGPSLTCSQSPVGSRTSVSNEDPPQSSDSHNFNSSAESNDAPRSSLGNILSRSRLGHHDANEQQAPTKSHGHTDTGLAEFSSLEPEPGALLFKRQTPQGHDVETAQQDLAKIIQQQDFPDPRASAHYFEDEAPSPGFHWDDADSDSVQVISDDEDDAEDLHHQVVLGVYSPALNRSTFLIGTSDTGAAASMLSLAKARLVAPDSISDDFSNLGTRTFRTLRGEVTGHGPIWVKFWLWREGRWTCYKAPFYVLPGEYREGDFDVLLNIKAVLKMGLVVF